MGISTVPNPIAGQEELHWFEANLHSLANYAGLWVAIVRDAVVASGGSAYDVYRSLASNGIADALMVHVPEDVNEDTYLIA